MLVNDPQRSIAMKRAPHPSLKTKARILPSLLIALTMCAAAGPAPPAHETERRVDGLLARMTLQEKLGQLQQLDSVPNVWRVRDEHRDLIPGPGRFVSQRARSQKYQRSSAHGRFAIAAENPVTFRFRRDPRLSHDFPDSPGGG